MFRVPSLDELEQLRVDVTGRVLGVVVDTDPTAKRAAVAGVANCWQARRVLAMQL